MTMPNPERAVVALEKLVNYCLSPQHPRGRHKARVFAAAIGLTAEHAEALRQALLRAASRPDAVEAERDSYGQRYVIDFDMTGPSGATASIRSAWIVLTGEDYPRFLACYVQ